MNYETNAFAYDAVKKGEMRPDVLMNTCKFNENLWDKNNRLLILLLKGGVMMRGKLNFSSF